MNIDQHVTPCKIPNVLACIPEGTRLIPACSIDPDREGWIMLPPETCNSEEEFQKWKDSMYNNAIENDLK